jgi:hypothetical protein
MQNLIQTNAQYWFPESKLGEGRHMAEGLPRASNNLIPALHTSAFPDTPKWIICTTHIHNTDFLILSTFHVVFSFSTYSTANKVLSHFCEWGLPHFSYKHYRQSTQIHCVYIIARFQYMILVMRHICTVPLKSHPNRFRGKEPSWEPNCSASQEISHLLHKLSLTYSQLPTTASYSEADESSPNLPILVP